MTRSNHSTYESSGGVTLLSPPVRLILAATLRNKKEQKMTIEELVDYNYSRLSPTRNSRVKRINRFLVRFDFKALNWHGMDYVFMPFEPESTVGTTIDNIDLERLDYAILKVKIAESVKKFKEAEERWETMMRLYHGN
jgi:hypothetical protein